MSKIFPRPHLLLRPLPNRPREKMCICLSGLKPRVYMRRCVCALLRKFCSMLVVHRLLTIPRCCALESDATPTHNFGSSTFLEQCDLKYMSLHSLLAKDPFATVCAPTHSFFVQCLQSIFLRQCAQQQKGPSFLTRSPNTSGRVASAHLLHTYIHTYIIRWSRIPWKCELHCRAFPCVECLLPLLVVAYFEALLASAQSTNVPPSQSNPWAVCALQKNISSLTVLRGSPHNSSVEAFVDVDFPSTIQMCTVYQLLGIV